MPTANADDHLAIWREYPQTLHPHRVEYLESAGGFSGARLWKCTTAAGEFCLRRWPAEHPSKERLEFIHYVLAKVAGFGVTYLPVPVPALNGKTFVRHAEHFWELAPWIPGVADFLPERNRQKLRAALMALGAFHLAARTMVSGESSKAYFPGLVERVELLDRLRAGETESIRKAIETNKVPKWDALAKMGQEWLALFPAMADKVRPRAIWAAHQLFPLSPCIRDIWHAHVLFEGNRVSGLIDFGSMRMDNRVTDIARLLGSLAEDDDGAWRAGIDEFCLIQPLSDLERLLLPAYDSLNVLLGCSQWLRWIFLEQRDFQSAESIEKRCRTMLARLKRLTLR